jgi:hypothetical protein
MAVIVTMKNVVEFLIHGTTEELERVKYETYEARERNRREVEALKKLVDTIRQRNGSVYDPRDS